MSLVESSQPVRGGLVFSHPACSEIQTLPTPAVLYIPLKQHQGRSASLLVNVGDTVFKGQALTGSDDLLRVPVHTSESGVVTHACDKVVTINTECAPASPPGQVVQKSYRSWSREQFIEHFHKLGLVGLGGACYPVAAKLRSLHYPAKHLVINAAECDPHITCDDALIQRHSVGVAKGIHIAMTAVGAASCIVGIEDNKPESIRLLKDALLECDLSHVCVVSLPSVYPSGAESQLLALTIGNTEAIGNTEGANTESWPMHPTAHSVISFNVATCYSMFQSIYYGSPLTSRVTTVHDNDKKVRNLQLPLGMPLATLATAIDIDINTVHSVKSGGHMMGTPVDITGAIEKASNCISFAGLQSQPKVRECIRCGACADVCPKQLQPQQLYAHSRNIDASRLLQLHLDQCIECRCCDTVCPSNLPLTPIFQRSKHTLQHRRRASAVAELAKQRFEKRERRLQLQSSRQSRNLKIKQDALTGSTTGNIDSKRQLVEAAMRRAQQKRQTPATQTESTNRPGRSKTPDHLNSSGQSKP